MARLKALIIGFPITELVGEPLDTLRGIRVRDWALFTMLPQFGIDSVLCVDNNAKVDSIIDQRFPGRIIRSTIDAKTMVRANEIDLIICSATKYHEFWRYREGFFKDLGANTPPTFGAFCYDNEQGCIDARFLSSLAGVSFTSHDHKLNWERRKTQVPAIVTTTGQHSKIFPITETDRSVVFIGYVHDARYIGKMASMAVADPSRTYHLVTSFIRDHDRSGKQYHKLPTMSVEARQDLVDLLIRKYTDPPPSNLSFSYLPPGEDEVLLSRAAVGLDFSWSGNQEIENSKICRYLTYGIFPISQMPATSSRFVDRFGYGAVVPYAASTQQWLQAINLSDARSNIEERRAIQSLALTIFDWRNVVAEISYFIHALDRSGMLKSRSGLL